MKKAYQKESRKGQIMLFTVLIFSATLLSVTTVAGLVTFYQLRQATNVANSVKAVYAAESGIELEFYRWFKDRADCHDPIPPSGGATLWVPTIYPTNPEGHNPGECYPAPTLTNGATYETNVAYREITIGGAVMPTIGRVRSTGQSVNSARAFQANL